MEIPNNEISLTSTLVELKPNSVIHLSYYQINKNRHRFENGKNAFENMKINFYKNWAIMKINFHEFL